MTPESTPQALGRAARAAALALAGGLCLAASAAGPVAAAPNFDSRVIVHAMEYPWSALGRVNTGGRSHCTGTLISERHVLTEARCLFYDVEGRWWSPQELHFVAGYQRDIYQIHSPVIAYRVAPAYKGGKGQTLANLTHNWALLTLQEPVGRQAGWLGLDWMTTRTRGRLTHGGAYVLEAGYRPGQPHVVTVSLSCSFDSLVQRQMQVDGRCRRLISEIGLSKLLFTEGTFRLLGTPSMRRDPTLRSVSAGSAKRGRAPTSAGPAQSVPYLTIQYLLSDLGYLGSGANGQRGPTRQAIKAYQVDRGLSVTGRPTISLMGYLLSSTEERAAKKSAANDSNL